MVSLYFLTKAAGWYKELKTGEEAEWQDQTIKDAGRHVSHLPALATWLVWLHGLSTWSGYLDGPTTWSDYLV